MDSVILYTTHCPSCKVLENMMDTKSIKYVEIDDVNYMVRVKGFSSVPMLEVDGEVMNYQQAFRWVNNVQKG